MLGSAECGSQQSCLRGTGMPPTMGPPGKFYLLQGNRALGKHVLMLSISTKPHYLLPPRPFCPCLHIPARGEQKRASWMWREGIWQWGRQEGKTHSNWFVCAKKKKKTEPLENVLTCMVGSIHFPGQEKKKVPVVHRSGDSELNPGEISCKYPASVSSLTRYAQWGSVHLLQEWNEEQIIVMSPFQMCGCRNPVGFP